MVGKCKLSIRLKSFNRANPKNKKKKQLIKGNKRNREDSNPKIENINKTKVVYFYGVWQDWWYNLSYNRDKKQKTIMNKYTVINLEMYISGEKQNAKSCKKLENLTRLISIKLIMESKHSHLSNHRLRDNFNLIMSF